MVQISMARLKRLDYVLCIRKYLSIHNVPHCGLQSHEMGFILILPHMLIS